MSSTLTQVSRSQLRRLPIVTPRGVLVDVRELPHSDRLVEHRKMRQTWLQTILGFAALTAMLAGAAYYFGGLTIMGWFGALWFIVLGASWFFSSRIAPLAVQAYAADPNTPYGAAAIRCADRAWELLTKYVKENHPHIPLHLLRRPPVMLSPNKHANAFCTGRDWNDSVIVIFEGLFLADMSDDEIVGVLCHELGHYFHLDVFTQTIASLIGAVFSLTVASAFKRGINAFFARLPKETDPVKFHAMQMLRLCEEAVLDSLGLMLFIDTLETLEHSEPAASVDVSWLRKFWERLMENHPPVEDRCAWLELAAGHACPLPGEAAKS